MTGEGSQIRATFIAAALSMQRGGNRGYRAAPRRLDLATKGRNAAGTLCPPSRVV